MVMVFVGGVVLIVFSTFRTSPTAGTTNHSKAKYLQIVGSVASERRMLCCHLCSLEDHQSPQGN
jgi:hypothetical protein